MLTFLLSTFKRVETNYKGREHGEEKEEEGLIC